MAHKLVFGVDEDLGIVALAKYSRKGVTTNVIVRSPGADAKSLIEAAHASARPVVMGLSGPQVFLKVMKLPGDIDRRAIDETVKWQLTDVIPDRIIRHFVTGSINNYWCVVVGGVHKGALNGLKVSALDLRVAALWRGALYFIGESIEEPIVVVEQTASGTRVVGGRKFLEFVREISSNVEDELQRTLFYYKSELGSNIRLYYVGRELPEETTAVGLALHYKYEPRFNFLVRERNNLLANLTAEKHLLKVTVVGAVAAALLFASAYGYRIQTSEYERRIRALDSQVKKYEALKAEREKYESWTAIVDSFAVSPTWPIIDDIRYAMPEKCWLVSLKTERPKPNSTPSKVAQGQNNDVSSDFNQATVSKAGSAAAKDNQIPPKAAKVVFEGYSLDVESVGMLRDNIKALPWCSSIESVRADWDDKVGAYYFKIVTVIK